MNLFQLNNVAYGDREGLGAYEVGHFLQHQQYLNILAGTGVILPDYNILHMQTENLNEFAAWLQAHQAVHEFLRQHTGISVADVSYFDPQSPESFELWQEANRAEHAAFDRHFGTT